MDGGKCFNRVQSGSFKHWYMAAALRVQDGAGWTTSILNQIGIQSQLQDESPNAESKNVTLTMPEKSVRNIRNKG